MTKVALVGCGRISDRHVEAIEANAGEMTISLVCDKREDRAKMLAEKVGCAWCTDYRTIRGVDVVSVLTPSGLHPRHVCNIVEQTDAPIVL